MNENFDNATVESVKQRLIGSVPINESYSGLSRTYEFDVKQKDDSLCVTMWAYVVEDGVSKHIFTNSETIQILQG